MGAKAGTADWLPGVTQAVGGRGHAEASCSPEPGLLLLQGKVPSVSGSAGLGQPHREARVGPRAAPSHESEASKRPARRSRVGRGALAAPTRGEGQSGRPSGLTPTPLSRSPVLPAAPLPVNASLLLQPTRPAGMRSPALPPHDALYVLAPSPPPASPLQSDTQRTGTNGAVPQMPPWHPCLGLPAWPYGGKGGAAHRLPPRPTLRPASRRSAALLCLPAAPLACPGPAPSTAQTKGWVIAHPVGGEQVLPCRRGSDWAEVSPRCPARDGAPAGRSYPGQAGQRSWHGLLDVGEQVGTNLLSPPRARRGPASITRQHAPGRVLPPPAA